MQGKSVHILLALGFCVTIALIWTHLKQMDLDTTTKITAAENDRHSYVISHDFGFLKEKLIESHRDHWQHYSEVQSRMKWELAGITILLVVFGALVVKYLRSIKKKRPRPAENV